MTPLEVIKTVANAYNTTLTEVLGFRKTRKIVDARVVSIFLLRTCMFMHDTEIAKIMGQCRSNINYSLREIADRLTLEHPLAYKVGLLQMQINGIMKAEIADLLAEHEKKLNEKLIS